MHVRMARFEGVDVSRLEEDYAQFRRMVRSNERPEWMSEDVFTTLRDSVRRVMSLADRDAGVTSTSPSRTTPRMRSESMRRSTA